MGLVRGEGEQRVGLTRASEEREGKTPAGRRGGGKGPASGLTGEEEAGREGGVLDDGAISRVMGPYV